MSRPQRRIEKRRASRRRAAPFACRLVVMAKLPVAGRVKTRLAGEAGTSAAIRFARHATAALLQRLGGDPRWRTMLAVTPDAGVGSRAWPRGLPRIAQGSGDLGRRMQRLFDRLPPGPVVIIGTDIPEVRAADIAGAFRGLGGHDAVLGPATDGGYWLIGLRRRPRVPRALSDVRWSTRHALADTLANLAGRSIARTATLSDVDTAQDLARAALHLGRRCPPPPVPQTQRANK